MTSKMRIPFLVFGVLDRFRSPFGSRPAPDPHFGHFLVIFLTNFITFKPVFNWKFKHYERLDLRYFPSPSPFPFAFPSPSSSPSPFLFPFPSPSPFLLLLLLHFLLLLFLRLHVQAGVGGWVGWGRSNPEGSSISLQISDRDPKIKFSTKTHF